MNRFALCLLFAVPVFAAPVPKATPKKEEPTMNGVWEVVERVNNGRPLKSRDHECWVFGDDTYTIYDGMKDVTGVNDPGNKLCSGAKLTPDSKDPTALDLNEGRNQNITRMQLDGDTLHIAIGIDQKKTRPAEAKPGQGVAYIKFQRVDPAKLKAPAK